MHSEFAKLWVVIGLAVALGFTLACGGGGGGGGPDVTAPTISSTSPADGATDVSIGALITATFNEAMDETTIDTTSFTVTGVTGTVAYDSATRVATFTPGADLAYETGYTVRITTDATDLAGNALAADNTWSFTTEAAPDTTAPTVTLTVPGNNDNNVARNISVAATFSEDMDATTITTTTFTLEHGGGPATGTVSYDSGSHVATFTPDANLLANTTYTATITTGVQDLAGNPMAADHIWQFTTGNIADVIAPVVVTTSPLDTETGVALRSTITATFNENMRASTITTATFVLNDGAAQVTGTVTYNSNTLTATFTPSSPLTGTTQYTATIKTGAQDLASNGLAADHVWSFVTTGAWTQLGGQVSTAGAESEDPTMLVANDKPAVGYRHESFRVHLHLWDETGLTWGDTATDPANKECNSSIHHTPAFCSNGTTIFMAYSHAGKSGGTDEEFYDRIFVYSWTEPGGWSPTAMNNGDEVSVPWNAVDGGANAWEPAILVQGGMNTPIVSWVETDVAPEPDGDDDVWGAVVADGWVLRGNPLSRNDTAGDYSTGVRCVGMEFQQPSSVYLAQWEQHHDEPWRTDLYVTESDNGVITNLGGDVASDYDSNNLCVPSVAIHGNRVYVAYSAANSSDYTRHVYVKEWDTNQWTTVSGGPVSAYSAHEHYDSANPSLLMVNGVLTIAWEESSQTDGYFIYTATYDQDSDQWLIDGDKLNIDTANSAHDPSLAYDATGDYLYVAFEEFTDGWPHIFVKRKRVSPPAP